MGIFFLMYPSYMNVIKEYQYIIDLCINDLGISKIYIYICIEDIKTFFVYYTVHIRYIRINVARV